MGITPASYVNMMYSPFLPMMYTNFGGDIQVTPYDINNYQLSCWLNPMAQYLQMQSQYSYMPCPQEQIPPQDVIQAQATAILEPIYGNMANQNICMSKGNISHLKTQIAAKLRENLSEEDKATLQNRLEQLEELEEKLKELEQTREIGLREKYIQTRDLSNEITQLVKDIRQEINNMQAVDGDTPPAADDNTPPAADDNTPPAADDNTPPAADDNTPPAADDNTPPAADDNTPPAADDNTPPAANNNTPPAQNTPPVAGTPAPNRPESVIQQQNNGIFPEEVHYATQLAYEAMYQWGTDDEKLEAVLNEIDEDNVMDFMLAWNCDYGKVEGESFMKAFMWDADHGQKKKYGRLIANKLRIVAKRLGIYNKCANDFAKIDSELNSWCWIDNNIYKNFDNIIKIIAEAEGRPKYSTPNWKTEESPKTEETASELPKDKNQPTKTLIA